MELLSVIRRWRYRQNFSIREIARRTGLSRNTVRKYLRSDSVEPKFNTPERPSRLDPFADKLAQMLRQEAAKSRKCQWRRENVPDGGVKVYRSGFEKRAMRPFWLRNRAR
jgi:transcriptional regulator with XRE-family HTH domain